MKTRYGDAPPYVTKDGTTIRELMHPALHGGRNQSLAEAVLEPGASSTVHRHLVTEEIYHFTGGRGIMILGGVEFAVEAGDTVLIAPGTAHGLCNTGADPLRLLCCCAPPYSHDDTELIEALAGKES